MRMLFGLMLKAIFSSVMNRCLKIHTKKAYAELKKKCEIIKDAFEFFNADYERMNKMMMTFRDNVVKMLQDKGDAIV